LWFVEAQVRHSPHVKEQVLANVHNAKEHVFANTASRHNARASHVHMRLDKAVGCAAVSTLSGCSCDIHSEYFAQFACGGITVEVVVL
jgi:hypothetical protein